LHRRDCFFAPGCGDPILGKAIFGRRNDVNGDNPSIAHVIKYPHLDGAGNTASCQSKTPRRGYAWGFLPHELRQLGRIGVSGDEGYAGARVDSSGAIATRYIAPWYNAIKRWYVIFGLSAQIKNGGNHVAIVQESRAHLRGSCGRYGALRNADIGRTFSNIRHCFDY
jgi:hypothetical protein